MWMMVLKIVVSAGIITAISGIAKQYPGIGGWIAALPVISLLSAFWLLVGHQPSVEIARFLTSVAKGLVPTAILLLCMVVCLRSQWSFRLSFAVSTSVWLLASVGLKKIGM
ncbi:DUF3147 family protein [Alicyclobacillus dauci]|uniref:DUF3147 family protein n=1 Tax=Alicyclobacillus dauci TaxID=1475485 RepID=A0ABY6Z4L0_9BACL|nr:DUF3147 family protein [Alicyclobacillus dauci]WAH37597.1 DUF3147 family protein [Alicyclobacillus dauci]